MQQRQDNHQEKDQRDERGLEKSNVTRPAPIEQRDAEKTESKQVGLEDLNITKPAR